MNNINSVYPMHKNISDSVLDVSQGAIEVATKQLVAAADGVRSLVGDILEVELTPLACDVWHERGFSFS
jgi:hypothetical protein